MSPQAPSGPARVPPPAATNLLAPNQPRLRTSRHQAELAPPLSPHWLRRCRSRQSPRPEEGPQQSSQSTSAPEARRKAPSAARRACWELWSACGDSALPGPLVLLRPAAPTQLSPCSQCHQFLLYCLSTAAYSCLSCSQHSPPFLPVFPTTFPPCSQCPHPPIPPPPAPSIPESSFPVLPVPLVTPILPLCALSTLHPVCQSALPPALGASPPRKKRGSWGPPP